MAEFTERHEHIVRAAMTVAEQQGWTFLSLSDVAEAASVSVAEFYRHYPSRSALLGGLSRLVDRVMLSEGPAEAEDSPKDRLFEVLMRRFDCLRDIRGGVLAVLRDLQRDPASACGRLFALERSMRWTLDLAHISAHGPLGDAKVRVLGLVYLAALRVWIHDESADMARTMAELDQRLRQAEQLANTFSGLEGLSGRWLGARKRRHAETPADDADDSSAATD